MKRILILICMLFLLVGCNTELYCYDECISGCVDSEIEELEVSLMSNCNESKVLMVNDYPVLCYRCDYVNWSWVCPV